MDRQMLEDLMWGLVGLFGVILFACLVTGVIVFGNNIFLERSCEKQAEMMGTSWRYSFMTGCYVQFQGKWVPLGSYRGNEPVWRPDTR